MNLISLRESSQRIYSCLEPTITNPIANQG
jgi:hypothetical protein